MTDSEVPQGNYSPPVCEACKGRGWVITAASPDHEPSDVSKNASGGGSQDSIDMQWFQDALSIWLATDEMDELEAAILAWHNTQLKAAMPEKLDTNGSIHGVGVYKVEPGAHMITREEGKALMPETFMTGQEWLDKFKAEYRQTLNYESQPQAIRSEVLEAAKRAGGLDE